MLEIGSTVKYHVWDRDEDDYVEEDVIIGGYIYYGDELYYIVIRENGDQEDVHSLDI